MGDVSEVKVEILGSEEGGGVYLAEVVPVDGWGGCEFFGEFERPFFYCIGGFSFGFLVDELCEPFDCELIEFCAVVVKCKFVRGRDGIFH